MNNKSNIFHIPLDRIDCVGRIQGDILYGIYKNNQKVYILTNIVVSDKTVVGFLEGVTVFCNINEYDEKKIKELDEFISDFYFSNNS